MKNNTNLIVIAIAALMLEMTRSRLFEPYVARKADNTIETKQLGLAEHDYTKLNFFTELMGRDTGYWSESYLDKDGTKAIVTTCAMPIRDDHGKILAIVGVDLLLDWIKEVITSNKSNI